MRKIVNQIWCLFLVVLSFSCNSNSSQIKQITADASYYAVISTDMGDITVNLYDATPLHRDNFIKLAESGFYDGLLFHRVIDGFMIQAGDPNSKNAQPGELLGNGGPGYDIDAEIFAELTHKRGVLAAARLGDNVNPEKKSSGSQFYLTLVPTPFLDGNYTVYGEITKGLEVIDAIGKVETDKNDRPVGDVKINTIKINKY